MTGRRSGHRRGPKLMALDGQLVALTGYNADALRAAAGGTCPLQVVGTKGGSCRRMCEQLVAAGLLKADRDGFGFVPPFRITPKGREVLTDWEDWKQRIWRG